MVSPLKPPPPWFASLTPPVAAALVPAQPEVGGSLLAAGGERGLVRVVCESQSVLSPERGAFTRQYRVSFERVKPTMSA